MLGEKIQKYRVDQHLTQEELGQKLHVSRAAISKWERNQGMPDIDNLRFLASLMNVSLEELLGEEKESQQEKVLQEKDNTVLRAALIVMLALVFSSIVFLIVNKKGKEDLTDRQDVEICDLIYRQVNRETFLRELSWDEKEISMLYADEVFNIQNKRVMVKGTEYSILLDCTYTSQEATEPTVFYVSYVYVTDDAQSAADAMNQLVQEMETIYGEPLRLTANGDMDYYAFSGNLFYKLALGEAANTRTDLLELWPVYENEENNNGVRARAEIYSITSVEGSAYSYVVTLTYYYTNPIFPPLGPARAFFDSIRVASMLN